MFRSSLFALPLMALLAPAPGRADAEVCLAAPSRACLIDLLAGAMPAVPPPGVVPPDMAVLVQSLLTARAREGEVAAVTALAPVWGADMVTRGLAEALAAEDNAAALTALATDLRATGRRATLLEPALTRLAARGHGAAALAIAAGWPDGGGLIELQTAVMLGLLVAPNPGIVDLLWPAFEAAGDPSWPGWRLVQGLGGAGRMDLAQEVAARIPDPVARVQARALLAAQTFDAALARAALADIAAIADPRAAAALTDQLLPLHELLDGRDRLDEVAGIAHPHDRMRAAVLLAQLHPGDPHHRAVALDLLAAAAPPETRRRALLAMAGGVNDLSRNLPLALALAEGIADPAERSRFLVMVANALAPEWEVQLQIALTLPASADRDRLVTSVVGLLAAEDAGRAVDLVQSVIRDPGRQSAALALIAARMP